MWELQVCTSLYVSCLCILQKTFILICFGNYLCLSPLLHELLFHYTITRDWLVKTVAAFPLCVGPNLVGSIFKVLLQGKSGAVASLCCETGNSTKPEVRQLCRILLNAPWHFGSKISNPKFPPHGHYKWCLNLPALRKLFFISLFITEGFFNFITEKCKSKPYKLSI